MNFVLDASVAIQYSRTSANTAILAAAGAAFVPVTWIVEISSAFHQAILAKAIDLIEARAALRRLQALRVRTIDPPDAPALFALQHRHALSAYDALYVAIALDRNLPIATRDQRLLRNLRARELGHLVLPAGRLPPPT